MHSPGSVASFRLVLLVACAAVGTQSVSHSMILSTTGAMKKVAAPVSVAVGAYENNVEIRVFEEKTNFTLIAPLAVDATTAKSYKSIADLTPGTLMEGLRVNTYYVHFDPLGSTSRTLTGSVMFDEMILGVEAKDTSLDATDALLGRFGSAYATGSSERSLELAPNEYFTISGDLHTFTFLSTCATVTDDLRIVTLNMTTPVEPKTWGSIKQLYAH